MPPSLLLIYMASASFVPILRPLPVLAQLTFPEFHFETEAKVDFPSACI